jgi:DNA excision repair protein ERCC-4
MSGQDPDRFVPCPFTLAIDTREQAAFDFRSLRADKKDGGGPLIIKTKRMTLKTGDYSIEGLEEEVSIERKELGDFLNCVGSDRERFEKQLNRLNALRFSAIVIEADWLRVLRGTPHSKLLPKTIVRSVIGWQMDYVPRIHWWFAPTRRHAEGFTYRMLDRFYRKHGTGSGNCEDGQKDGRGKMA